MYLRWGILLLSLLAMAGLLLLRRRHVRFPVLNWGRVGIAVAMCVLMFWGLAAIEPGPTRPARRPTTNVTICRFAAARFPRTSNDFVSMVQQGIGGQLRLPTSRRVVQATGPYPNYRTLQLNLTDAVIPLEYDQPRSTNEPATLDEVAVERLTVIGEPVLYHAAKMQARLTASKVRFGIEYDKRHKPLLMLMTAREGELNVDVKVSEIEKLLLVSGQEWGAKNKVELNEVHLKLSMPRGQCVAVDLEFKATGKVGPIKVPGAAKLSGLLEIDDQLQGHLKDLKWEGKGVIGSIAGALFEPFIQRYNGYSIPLNVFTSGDLHTKDIKVSLDDALHVKASFTADPVQKNAK